MSKKGSGYWEERIAKQTWKQYNSIELKNRALIEHYQKALKEVQHALYDYAGEDGTLSRSKLYEKRHLQNLQKEISDKVVELTEQFENIAKENMVEGAKSTSENIFKALNNTGIKANDNLIEKVYDQEWKGSFFSERLWNNTTILANQLNTHLTQGLTQGKTVTQIAIDVQNVMGGGFNDTIRVIRSETMHALNESTLHSYKASGVKYVRIWSAEDERTCPTCSKYHNKLYRIDQVPTLPIHPNCRCTIIPEFEEELNVENISELESPTDVIIDKFTPCLENRDTGEIVQTQSMKLKKNISKIFASKLKETGWQFDWSKPQSLGADVYALVIEGEKEIQGLISTVPVKNDLFVYIPIVESAPHNIGSSGKYEGVGAHLFAIACQQSFDEGFDGYVSFKPKTLLKKHYMEKLGAQELPNGNLYIDTKNAKILVDKYIKKGGKE